MKFSKIMIRFFMLILIAMGLPSLVYAKNSNGHGRGHEEKEHREKIKHQGIDQNGNGVISRDEWRGAGSESFESHDWNGDGVLTGNELKPGAHRPSVVYDNFRILDPNNNGYISEGEWRNSSASFIQLDRNRDGILSRDEFYNRSFYPASVFDALDSNNDTRISRSEWRSSGTNFTRLDTNKNNFLSLSELTGQTGLSLVEQLFQKIFR